METNSGENLQDEGYFRRRMNARRIARVAKVFEVAFAAPEGASKPEPRSTISFAAHH